MALILAQKLRNELYKEAAKSDMAILVTLRNITVNGAKRGCSGHVRNRGTGIVMYVNTEGSCYEPLLDKAMYRYAADEKDYSSARIPNGFNQWCDEAELAACVITGLKV